MKYFLVVCTLLFGAVSSYAQQEMRIVVGFQAGGVADILARKLSKEFEKNGMNVIVENKPGAAGKIAYDYVKNASPDGLIVYLATSATMAVTPHVKPGMDVFRDLRPVSHLGSYPSVLVAGRIPCAELASCVALMLAQPKYATYGSPGSHTFAHLVVEMFAKEANLSLAHVPYNGFAPVVQDLCGGHIPFGVVSVDDVIAQRGCIRALAVSGASRVRSLPGVPTLQEGGYGIASESWFGVYVPAGTPSETVARLSVTFQRAMTSEDIRIWVESFGTATGTTPEELATIHRRDFSAFGTVIRRLKR